MCTRLQVLVVLMLALSQKTISQDTAISIQRIKSDIIFDGLSNEDAWSGIIPFKPVIQRPVFGKDPTEITEILVAYDVNYIYVAGRLYDKEADKIQANSYKRDAGNASSEWFGIALDTYNDNENAMAFFTTPTGLRWDANIIEGPGGIAINTDWNTFWDVKTTQNNDGWFAELRIPFSSLRFQEENNVIQMGMISWRMISRKNEWIIYPPIPDNWPISFYKISLAQTIQFADIKRKSPVYIAPYLLSGYEARNIPAAGNEGYQKTDNSKLEAGMDLKYGITSNLTLDATINTDFSQVEIDDQVIQLDRFSVFMPEKRQFFLERSRNFEFNFNGSNQIFYSRQIGIKQDKPVRILGGLRIVGRTGRTDIGLLDMQTASIDTFPSENLGVIRLKRKAFNKNSYIGGIATSKIGTNGKYDVVCGLDGVFQIKSDDYLKVAVAQNIGNEHKREQFSEKNTRYNVELERRTNIGLNYLLGTSYVGKNYNPSLGFENWQDYHSIDSKLGYSWLAAEKSKIYKNSLKINPYIFWNNSDGKVDIYEINPSLTINTKSGFSFDFINHYLSENIRDTTIFLNNIKIPSGNYNYDNIELNLYTPEIFPVKAVVSFKGGGYYHGHRIMFAFKPVWNVSRNLEIEVNYQYNRITIPDQQQVSESHLIRLRALYMLNTRLSVAAFVQTSNIEKLSVSNFRFRFNPREGNDLYIVYNHGFNTHREEMHPALPATKNWNISVKYVNTFILK